MADANKAIERTLEHEGVLSNDKDDSGGLTKYGISHASYPNIDIRNLTLDDAKRIYRRDFWNPLGLSGIESQWLAEQVYDHGVVGGTGTTVLLLQHAYNLLNMDPPGAVLLVEDGVLGPKTRLAVNTFSRRHPQQLINAFRAERLAYFRDIVHRHPEKGEFYAGWMARVFDV